MIYILLFVILLTVCQNILVKLNLLNLLILKYISALVEFKIKIEAYKFSNSPFE